MKKLGLLFFATFFVLIYVSVPHLALGEYTAPMNISNSSGSVADPWIATDGIGKNIYVVWEENGEIFTNCSPDSGNTFYPPIQLSSGEGTNSSPRIAVNQNQSGGVGQQVGIVWVRGNQEIIFSKKYDYYEYFDGAEYVYQEIQCFDSSSDPYFDLYSYPETIASNQGNTESVSLSNSQAIGVIGADFYVVWTAYYNNGTTGEISFKHSVDWGQWCEYDYETYDCLPVPVTSFPLSGEYSGNPAFSHQGQDIFIGWDDTVSGTNNDIFYVRSEDGGDTFTPVINLSNTSENSHNANVAMHGRDVYVAWEEGNGTVVSHSEDRGEMFNYPVSVFSTMLQTSGKRVVNVGLNGLPGDGVYLSESFDFGDTFSSPQNIINPNGSTKRPVMTLAGARVYLPDSIFIVYPEVQGTGNDQIMFIRNLIVDSDKDGLSDEHEITIYDTDPLTKDSDGDSLSDGAEIKVYNTDPLLEDADNGGSSDGSEVPVLTDPFDPNDDDPDGDRLTNDQETSLGTDPNLFDTDGNGISDGDEDFDGDGFANWVEFRGNSDPYDSESHPSTFLLYRFDGEGTGDVFGCLVEGACDLNGDDIPDVVVGAFDADPNGLEDSGRVYVYSGSNGELLYTVDGEAEFDRFGLVVDSIGDVNGDGLCDLIVSSGGGFNGGPTGKAFIISGVDGSVIHRFNGGPGFGNAVEGIGDVDGDNIPDVVIGAFGDWSGTFPGAAYVYSGASGNLLHMFDGNDYPGVNSFGRSVAKAGDVDADGISDIMIAAPWSSVGGSVFVFSGADWSLIWRFDGDEVAQEGEYLNLGGGWFHGVSSAGDVNGDGHADLLIGDSDASLPNGLMYAGSAFVFSGATGQLFYRIDGDEEEGSFGHWVEPLGDMDGDGKDDFIIGAPAGGPGGPGVIPGYASLYSGATGELIQKFDGERNGDAFGFSVSPLDSNTILVMGSPNSDFSGSDYGAAYVYKLAIQSANQPPVANAGTDQTIEAISSSGASVTLNGTSSSDVDGDPLTFTWSGPFGIVTGAIVTVNIPLGSHLVTLMVTDASGESDTDAVQIMVEDTTPPIIAPPANITKEATGSAGAIVTYSVPSATDAVDPNPTVVCAPASGTTFNLGITAVNCTATDFSGNNSIGSFSVTVVDTTPPALLVPVDLTVEATSTSGAIVNYSVSASDIADPSPSVTCIPASGTTFSLGMTTINCTATDASNNSSSGSFTVTVVDTTPPSLTVPGDIAVVATGLQTVVDIGTAIATDTFPVTINNDAPATFVVGTTVVTWTAIDENGNTTTGGQTVTASYSFGGFLPPLENGGVYKLNRVLPVKFQLSYADGTSVSTAYATITMQLLVNNEPAGDPIDVTSTSEADSGNTFRFENGQYIFNLDTKTLTIGTYRLMVDLHDGSEPKFIDIGLK